MGRTKRVISRFLVALLALTFLTSAAALAEEKQYERVKIHYAGPQVVEGYDYNTGDEYSKFILNKFNFEFESSNVPWGEWHSTLSTWIMAQDMPDVVNLTTTTARTRTLPTSSDRA